MQSFEGELNHLAKLEEFLRVKGSRRICEADEKEEMKRLEELAACERDIAMHDALLEEIFVSDVPNIFFVFCYVDRSAASNSFLNRFCPSYRRSA